MANRIREIRLKKGIKLEDLAEETGISSTMISRIQSNKRGLSLENAMKLARALEVEIDEMTDEFHAEDLQKLATHGSNILQYVKPPVNPDDHHHRSDTSGPSTGEIPEILLTAGLGGGGLAIVEVTGKNGVSFAKESVRDHWRLPEWMLNRLNVRAAQVACFPVQGDSMEPTLEDGDVVFIDTMHRVPSPPGIYALADEFGGVVVKRLEVISRPGEDNVEVSIKSDNPRHGERMLTLAEISILGRYLGKFAA
jgi:transcriptional regulator with XRE-family HTH domain